MEKYDYAKDLKELYGASAKKCSIIKVPEMKFLMIDGVGDPNTSADFANACEALFSVSYSAKFFIKNELKLVDYRVFPLEGLWWADDMSVFTEGRKDEFKWTLMVCQPKWMTADIINKQIELVKAKKGLEALSKLRYDAFTEGLSAQILHIGPFSEEGPTILRLHEFIEAEGKTMRGKHHEIYLSDIRRAVPDKWKTIIRQPIN